MNEYMTQHGFAFSSEYPPDTKYQDRIAAAEAAARSAQTCPPARKLITSLTNAAAALGMEIRMAYHVRVFVIEIYR